MTYPYPPPAGGRPMASAAEAAPRRRGPHLGPFRITPLRVTLVIALAGGIAFLAYATFIRDQLQVPLMATGFAVLGIVFAVVAVLSVRAVIQAGREGRDARAVLSALAGGIIAVGAFMCLSAAVIMGLIWTGTKST
jgi:hypothetical protein